MSGSELEKPALIGGDPRLREDRRRRSWTSEEKQRILAESHEPGASVSVVARRHDMNANMLFTWRREARAASSSPGNGAMTFAPARIMAGAEAPISPPPPSSSGRIEIMLAGGDRVIVGADVDAIALTRVIKVLARR